MKKPIRILISVIILLFGYIIADCVYGFTFGGEISWKTGLIVFIFGIIFTSISIIIIFNKKERKTGKSKDTFVIILLVFTVICLFGYKPLNRISGNNEYIEYPVEVVDLCGAGKNFPFLDPQYYVTVKDENGKVFEVGDYDILCEYDEGDTVLLREYKGGFNLKYYSISK